MHMYMTCSEFFRIPYHGEYNHDDMYIRVQVRNGTVGLTSYL